MNYGQLYKFETKLNFFTDYWRFPLDQKIPPILKRGQKLKKKTEISWEIFPENPVKVDFPRSELFNQKFQGFREEGQMERKFLVGNFRKFQYNTQGHIF